MKAIVVRQPAAGAFQHAEVLFETMLKPLVNAAQPPRFPASSESDSPSRAPS